jgi:uncharacterized protein YfiM (DUF2279 family)
MYASGTAGLYRSATAGATWDLFLKTDVLVSAVSVSRADESIIYVALRKHVQLWLWVTTDDGNTWQQADYRRRSLCSWTTPIVAPDPIMTARVYLTAGCYAARSTWNTLDQSDDFGASWVSRFGRPDDSNGERSFPERLNIAEVGSIARIYLATSREFRVGGSSLFRSDDAAITWKEVLSHRGGATYGPPPYQPNTTIDALAVDRSNPDVVFVGLNTNRVPRSTEPTDGARVLRSSDGGATWNQLGADFSTWIRDLALTNDGRTLFAATDAGVFSIDLHGFSAP